MLRGTGRLLSLAWLALLLPACLTPPAVAPAGFAELRATDYPPGAEFVELPVAEGAVLRGVYLPAGDDAPLVVHFPGMLESVSGGAHGNVSMVAEDGWLVGRHDLGAVQFSAQIMQLNTADEAPDFTPMPLHHGLFTALRRAGLSLLFVDYEGVGASTGARSPEHLARDARAVWEEALRRVDGDPQRVVLRGVSLGTLAVASLLEGGAHPGAISLAAPVRGESVVGHVARLSHGGFVSWLADLFYADVGSADLQAQVERTPAALFLALPEHDALLSEQERALLRHAAEQRGATVLVHGALHEQLAVNARTLLPGEQLFLETNLAALARSRAARSAALLGTLERDPLVAGKLRDLDAEGRALLERFAAARPWPDPRLPLILALRRFEPAHVAAIQTWCDWQDPAALAALPWNPLEALVELDDPLMNMEPEWIDALAPAGPALRATLRTRADVAAFAARFADGAESWASEKLSWRGAAARLGDPAASLCWRAREFADDGRRAAGLPRDVAPRLGLRLALRAAGVPDRARHDDAGRVHEVWWEGAWVRVSGLEP